MDSSENQEELASEDHRARHGWGHRGDHIPRPRVLSRLKVDSAMDHHDNANAQAQQDAVLEDGEGDARMALSKGCASDGMSPVSGQRRTIALEDRETQPQRVIPSTARVAQSITAWTLFGGLPLPSSAT